jgi:hypothetical protein
MGGGTTTGADATTTGAGAGIPKLIPKRTPAFTAVIPTAARARIAIAFFIMAIDSTRRLGRTTLQRDYCFVSYRRHLCHPKVLPFQPQFPASTSLKFK